MALIMGRGFDRNFVRYREEIEQRFQHNLINELQRFYQRNQDWEILRNNSRAWNEMIHRSSIQTGDPAVLNHAPEFNNHRPPLGPPLNHPPAKPTSDETGLRRQPFELPLLVLNKHKKIVIGPESEMNENTILLKILSEKDVIGYLGVKPFRKNNSEFDRHFSENIRNMLTRVALLLFTIAIIISFPVAKYFTRRINIINQATQKVASGDFTVRINENSQKDEIGQLIGNFNHLAHSLESNSKAQRTMMADIAHELRTPVAVILGEIEAIQDGIHPANKETFALLHSQISSLKNLINDLHELSESDLGSLKYEMQKLDLSLLIKQSYQSFQNKFSQKDISLELYLPKHSCFINGDANRLNQLINNLLNNSYDYTDSNGRVLIKLSDENSIYRLVFSDSKPGLSKEQLQHIFDRLYRGEDSRNRNSGGSGLGLAICKEIAKAHNAEIRAESSKLGGINIILEFEKL